MFSISLCFRFNMTVLPDAYDTELSADVVDPFGENVADKTRSTNLARE